MCCAEETLVCLRKKKLFLKKVHEITVGSIIQTSLV